MPRFISLAALTVLELTPPEMVSCAAKAGYSHVGIRVLPATPTEPQHDMVGDTPLVREVQRRLADTGVKVLDVEIFRMKPETRVAADYEAAFATAAALSASELLVAGNDADEARLIDNFAAFCELAGRYGLGVGLEFMPWTGVKDLLQATRIVAAVAGASGGAGTSATAPGGNVAVLIDPFHFSRSHSRLEDIAAIPPAWLRCMQFCDVPAAIPPTLDDVIAQARGERRFPGQGDIDLLGLLRAVPPGIPLSVEVPMQSLARTVGATERARRALVATQGVLAQLQA